jgi:hypothetical protein
VIPLALLYEQIMIPKQIEKRNFSHLDSALTHEDLKLEEKFSSSLTLKIFANISYLIKQNPLLDQNL